MKKLFGYFTIFTLVAGIQVSAGGEPTASTSKASPSKLEVPEALRRLSVPAQRSISGEIDPAQIPRPVSAPVRAPAKIHLMKECFPFKVTPTVPKGSPRGMAMEISDAIGKEWKEGDDAYCLLVLVDENKIARETKRISKQIDFDTKMQDNLADKKSQYEREIRKIVKQFGIFPPEALAQPKIKALKEDIQKLSGDLASYKNILERLKNGIGYGFNYKGEACRFFPKGAQHDNEGYVGCPLSRKFLGAKPKMCGPAGMPVPIGATIGSYEYDGKTCHLAPAQ